MHKLISNFALFECIRLAIKIPICFAVIILTAFLTKDVAATKAALFAIFLADVPGMIVDQVRIFQLISFGQAGEVRSFDYSRRGRLLTLLSGTTLIAVLADGENALVAQLVLTAGLTAFFLALDALRRRMEG